MIVERHRINLILRFFLNGAYVLVLILVSCGRSTEQANKETKPQFGGTFIYALNGPPITLDPALVTEALSTFVTSNIFDGLVEQRSGRIAIDPALAESWKISSDQLVYTFYLRRNLRFHDGTPLNADAVVFSFERQRNSQHPFHWNNADYAFWRDSGMSKLIKSIRVIDQYTVEFSLYEPNATFLSILSSPSCAIISPDAFKKYGRDFDKNPVGTGPFRFVQWKDDVVLTANEQYWSGRPFVDSVVFRTILNDSNRLSALRSGEVYMMDFFGNRPVTEIEKLAGIKQFAQPGLNITYVAMNMKKKPFDDIRIRQAIVLAIDREKLVEETLKGTARTAKNPIPPVLPGYDDRIRPTPFDPEKSKQLLHEAGYSNGIAATLLVPEGRGRSGAYLRLAQSIQTYLLAVNIDITIKTLSYNDFYERTRLGLHDMAISGWVGDIPDADNFFYPLLDKNIAELKTSSNLAFYKNDEMHELILSARNISDMEKRGEIYKKACAVFNRDLPWFTVAHFMQIILMKESVMDFQPHVTTFRRFNKLWIKKES